MSKPTPPEYHVAPWILVAVFVIMTVTALQQVLQIRDRVRAEVRDDIGASLQRGIASWERRQLDELSLSLDRGFITRDAADYQVSLRRQSQLVDSFYMWTIADSAFQGQSQPTWLHPLPSATEVADAYPSHPCLEAVSTPDAAERAQAVRGLTQRCASAPLAISMHASAEELEALLDEVESSEDGESSASLLASYRSAPTHLSDLGSARLLDARDLGISTYDLARHLVYWAMLEIRTGNEVDGLNAIHRVGLDITRLNALDAREVIPLVYQRVLPELRGAGRYSAVEMMEAHAERAVNRIAASRDVGERISQMLPTSGERTTRQMSHDPFSSESYILFYGWDSDGSMGGALQVNAKPLLRDLLESKGVADHSKSLVVLDRAGQVVAGPARNGPLGMRVPMGQFFPDYELAVYASLLDVQEEDRSESWLFPLVLVVFVASLGVVAFVIQLQGMRRQYELLERQREFTARVTHELKTPIAGIRIMAESLMLGTYSDKREIEDWSERIIHEADRLKRRVDAILRRAHETAAPAPKALDLAAEVNRVLAVWRERYEAENCVLDAEIATVQTCRGEPGAIRDLVGALLDNALKYRKPEEPKPWVRVSLSEGTGEAVLTVSDNGMGVPSHMRKGIFEAFVRVEGDHRGRAGGHGLGLSQVLETVNRHGGQIRCGEDASGGACFIVRLPLGA